MITATEHHDDSSLTEYPASGISMGRVWVSARSLLVETISIDQVRWSDVIVYRASQGLIAHRVIKVVKRADRIYWMTKGDGYWTPDRVPVSGEQLVGVVRAIRTHDGCTEVGRGWSAWAGYVHAFMGRAELLIWPPIDQIAARK